MKKKKKFNGGQIALHLFFIILSLCYILPFIMIISVSFEGAVTHSFSLIPQEFSTEAYKLIFAKPIRILKAYGVTIFYSVVGTFGSLVVMSMFAYAISKRDFKYRNPLTFLLFFTTLFSGGIVPSYLVNSNLLHLNNTIWIYIFPTLINAWNVIVIRTFFQGISQDLFDSARIDGASEVRIWSQIVIPLSTPVLASVGFLGFIDRWNNWMISQIYIRNPDLYSLQYMLKLIIDSQDALKELANSLDSVGVTQNLEAMRYAMAVVAIGPMCAVFPFFQKYFAKGMTLGSVKS